MIKVKTFEDLFSLVKHKEKQTKKTKKEPRKLTRRRESSI